MGKGTQHWPCFSIVAKVGKGVSFASPADFFLERSSRIVGGFNAGTNQFPWQVSLRTTASPNFHFCGAVIVSNRHVISAAHCTVGRGGASVRIVMGTVFINSGGVAHTSTRISNHPNYNSNTIANDISVVMTAATISFTAAIQQIAMGTANHGATAATVSGWGGTAVTGGPSPNHLQGLNTRTITNADCRARHTAGNAAFVFDHKICTFTQAGQGICQGDSGGPLVAGGAVVGIVSWNIPCARGFPDAYDRVSSHRTWILSVM